MKIFASHIYSIFYILDNKDMYTCNVIDVPQRNLSIINILYIIICIYYKLCIKSTKILNAFLMHRFLKYIFLNLDIFKNI